MKVYEIKSDVAKFQYFHGDTKQDRDKLRCSCEPKLLDWIPPQVFIYHPLLKAGDFYHFGSGAPILSPIATELLRTHLEMAGELLPIPYNKMFIHCLIFLSV